MAISWIHGRLETDSGLLSESYSELRDEPCAGRSFRGRLNNLPDARLAPRLSEMRASRAAVVRSFRRFGIWLVGEWECIPMNANTCRAPHARSNHHGLVWSEIAFCLQDLLGTMPLSSPQD